MQTALEFVLKLFQPHHHHHQVHPFPGVGQTFPGGQAQQGVFLNAAAQGLLLGGFPLFFLFHGHYPSRRGSSSARTKACLSSSSLSAAISTMLSSRNSALMSYWR